MINLVSYKNIGNSFSSFLYILGSGSTEIFSTHKFLCHKLKESGKTKIDDQVFFLKEYLEKRTNCPKSKISNLHKKISYFISDFKKKWSSSYRMKERFVNTNSL